MSESFSDKDYAEYFSKIEQSLSGNSAQTPPAVRNIPEKRVRRAKKKKIRFARVFIFVVLILAAVVFALQISKGSKPIKSTDKNEPEIVKKVEETLFAEMADDAVYIDGENSAENIIFINCSTNEIVAHKNYNTVCYPASTTKIMTLLVASELADDLDDTFEMTFEITDSLYREEASVVGFSPGEKVTVRDMLYGAVLSSGADATVGLANKLAGSEEAFVALMNEEAEKLGLKNTHFTNTSGLYDANHYTTAEDMAVILRAAIKNSLCREILSTYKYTTSKTPEHPDGISISATLFNYMYGTEPETATILGGKTGYVDESGYCIASFGVGQSGDEYICVNLKSVDRYHAFFEQIDLYKLYGK